MQNFDFNSERFLNTLSVHQNDTATSEEKVQNVDLKQFADRIYKFQNLNNNILQLYRRFCKPDDREKITELAPPIHASYQKNSF